MASIDHFMFKKIMKGLKNILQSLCTHSVFCPEKTLPRKNTMSLEGLDEFFLR